MAIPISIEKLLDDNIVEWARIEFKKGWNPDETLKTISAFANDLDNWGGGYVVIGAEEKNGRLIHPVAGLNENELDGIQKELLRYCKYLKPNYIPQSEPVRYEGKWLIMVWCPGGYDRPYQCPKMPTSKSKEKTYYIRKLASTIEASDADIKELMALAHNVPYDDRINPKAQLEDLNYSLILNFLNEVGSNLLASADTMDMKAIASSLRIAGGPCEYFKPLNVGLLFFNSDPERFFPYCRIEVVNIPDPTGQGMEERIFRGPIDAQLRGALNYLRNNCIAEKVFKVSGQAEAIRVTNYSYDALEEFVSNAVYHRSYQEYDPITIRIESDRITITSVPGPDRSISDENIKNYQMHTNRYRNRRIGDFLKELHLAEGRNTGIPTALRAIKANGSPLPEFLTDEERSFFTVVMPIHKAFLNESMKDLENPPGKKNGRRKKSEIKREILENLSGEDMSAGEIYRAMGYRGNVSGTFKKCINELIEAGLIEYSTPRNKNDPGNKLRKIQ